MSGFAVDSRPGFGSRPAPFVHFEITVWEEVPCMFGSHTVENSAIFREFSAFVSAFYDVVEQLQAGRFSEVLISDNWGAAWSLMPASSAAILKVGIYDIDHEDEPFNTRIMKVDTAFRKIVAPTFSDDSEPVPEEAALQLEMRLPWPDVPAPAVSAA